MHNPKYLRACLWLLFATAIWGISFPFIKAILLVQEQFVPGASSIFFEALAAALRFIVAGAIIAFFAFRTLRQLTRSVLAQGVGLAFFGGMGYLFKIDGLA